MRIIASENYVELVPETDWEVAQLNTLNSHRHNFVLEVIDKPGEDRYTASLRSGGRLRFKFPEDDWGT